MMSAVVTRMSDDTGQVQEYMTGVVVQQYHRQCYRKGSSHIAEQGCVATEPESTCQSIAFICAFKPVCDES